MNSASSDSVSDKTMVSEQHEAVVAPEQIAANLRAWITALRSGAYSQCKSVLREAGVGHCCLGVAYEVGGGSWTDQEKASIGDGSVRGLVPRGNGGNHELLYGEQLDRFGLDIPDGKTLAEMNDNGDGFASIADFIEQHFLPRYENQPTA